eukprot:18644-Heterococcus_DN1.PRE.3
MHDVVPLLRWSYDGHPAQHTLDSIDMNDSACVWLVTARPLPTTELLCSSLRYASASCATLCLSDITAQQKLLRGESYVLPI